MHAKKLISMVLCMMTGISGMNIAHAEEPEAEVERAAFAQTVSPAEITGEDENDCYFWVYIYDCEAGEEVVYGRVDELENEIDGLIWDAGTATVTMENLSEKTWRINIGYFSEDNTAYNLVLSGTNEVCVLESYCGVRISGSGTLNTGMVVTDDIEMVSGTLNIQSEYLIPYYTQYPDGGTGGALFSMYGQEESAFLFHGGTVNISGDYNIGIDQYAGNIEIINAEINIDLPKFGSTGLACGTDYDDEISGGNLRISNSRVFIRTKLQGSALMFCYVYSAANDMNYYSGKNTIQKKLSLNGFFTHNTAYSNSNVLSYARSTRDFADQNCLLITNEFQFTDAADKTKYFYEPVYWAYRNGITTGTSPSTFSPDDKVTRGQIAAFLYRAAGEPDVSGNMPFTDVKKGAYYEKAVLWAAQNNITTGTSPTTFAPNAYCTRGQIVTFLYRFKDSPAVSGNMPFTDVKKGAYYEKAVLWAYNSQITTGTGKTAFSPDDTCTRAQAVTFLYRAVSGE